MKAKWQDLSVSELEKSLDTSAQFGLTEDKVLNREKGKKHRRKSAVLSFLAQFASLYHIVLVILAVLLICTGSSPEGILVLAALLVHCVYATVCTVGYEKAMETATRMKMPELTVIRSGEEKKILADHVVDGDLILLEPGERVAFQVRVSESDGCLVAVSENGEEQEENEKNPEFLEPGQKIIFGRGKGIVVNSEYVPPVYMKKKDRMKFEDYIYLITMAVFFLSAVIMLIYSLKGVNPLELMLSFVGLFLAICPLDMLSAFRLCEMDSLKKLNKNSTLTKDGAELLRNADRILLKDNDLVCDNLVLRGIVTEYKDIDVMSYLSGADGAVVKMIKMFACRCTKTDENSEQKNEVELSIIESAKESGIYKEILTEKYPLKFENETDDRYTIGVTAEEGVRIISSGKPEAVLELCSKILTDGSVEKLSDEYREKMLEKAEKMGKSGMYVTAIAYSDNDDDTDSEKNNLCFLALLGSMHSNDRDKTETVSKLKKVNLKPLYITALAKEKALSVASGAGLDKILTSEAIRGVSDKELEKILPDIEIISGADDEIRERVLNLMKKSGTTVLYPVKSDRDIKESKLSNLKIALTDAPEWVQRQCGGSVGFMRQIPELKRDAVNTYRNKNNILRAFVVSKLGILIFALLCAMFTAKPLTFLQMLWISMVILPATNWFLQRKDANSKGVSGKILAADSILWGVLFGIVLVIAQLMNASVFWAMTLGVLVIGLQAGSGKAFIGGGFLSNKKALFSIGAVFAATLLVQLVPALNEIFVLDSVTVPKVLLSLVCVAILIIGTDVLKYVQFLMKEKVKKNGRTEA